MPKKTSFPKLNEIPRNLWFVSLTSFFMDISSEMVLNITLFMQNVLKVPFVTIGIIEGIAEATASVLKVFSGWLSDKLGTRKWLAVLGYGISALIEAFLLFCQLNKGAIAGIRWMDRFGKGIRTAPRDALVADSVKSEHRGFAFGLNRAADTAGAFLGILIAAFVVWKAQAAGQQLSDHTFRTIVLISIIPAFLAVLSLAMGAKDVAIKQVRQNLRLVSGVLARTS